MAAFNYKVTYRNVLNGKRYTLVDELSEDDAKRIAATFSDKSRPDYYMPECRVEKDALIDILMRRGDTP